MLNTNLRKQHSKKRINTRLLVRVYRATNLFPLFFHLQTETKDSSISSTTVTLSAYYLCELLSNFVGFFKF